MRTLYRIHDSDPSQRGCVQVATPADAEQWNARGFGIFWAVNEFNGPRQIAHLERIRSWTTEIDGDKAEQVARLNTSPLVPSLIIESKNGFHTYWDARPGARADRYKQITTALAQHFRGDMNARDLSRVLRVPGYLHQKDPADPFMVRQRHEWRVTYTEDEMARAFGIEFDDEKQPAPSPAPSRAVFPVDGSEDFWERAGSLGCRAALERLSGHWSVGGETFTFQDQRNGKSNILCDGKSTSCWIDANDCIGSSDGGGPHIAQWLKWYLHDYRAVRRVLLEVFPELEVKR